MRFSVPFSLSLLAALACARQPPPGLAGRDWILIELDGQAAPPGAEGQPATMRFDSTSRRASGFAGCNRYSAGYTLAGDSIGFGPAVSTKMACADGDELERGLLDALPRVTGYAVSDSLLLLVGAGATVARFRAP
jgi:heat shock protein HslJ